MLTALMILAAAAVDSETSFETFFEDFAKKRDTVRVFEARFRQTSYTTDETVLSTGTIVYVRPRRILFRYEEPEQVYLIDDKTLYDYDPEIKQVDVYPLDDQPEMDVFFLPFDGDTKRLEKVFEIAFLDAAGGLGEGVDTADVVALGFRPRPAPEEEEDVPPSFEEVRIYLRGPEYTPCRIVIVNDPESRVVFDITGVKKNAPLEPGATYIRVPEGTDVVYRDGPAKTVGPEGLVLPPLPMAGEAAE